MDGKIEGNAKYPIWCWVKCYNNICPPKHRGKPVEGFDVKISFTKSKEDVFITDFRRYSFNYERSNGKRINWIEDFYKKLSPF